MKSLLVIMAEAKQILEAPNGLAETALRVNESGRAIALRLSSNGDQRSQAVFALHVVVSFRKQC